jgi:hypothetical protein
VQLLFSEDCTVSIGFVFWLLMILWLVFGLYWSWPADRAGGPRAFAPVGGNLMLFVLLFLVGWRAFGFPIQG